VLHRKEPGRSWRKLTPLPAGTAHQGGLCLTDLLREPMHLQKTMSFATAACESHTGQLQYQPRLTYHCPPLRATPMLAPSRSRASSTRQQLCSTLLTIDLACSGSTRTCGWNV
jgi:hypothetical protein